MKPTPKGPMKLDDLSVILRQPRSRVSGLEFEECSKDLLLTSTVLHMEQDHAQSQPAVSLPRVRPSPDDSPNHLADCDAGTNSAKQLLAKL